MILVTGANGLVGSHIVLRLLQEGEKVVALVRPGSDTTAMHTLLAFHKQESSGLTVSEGDLLDLETLLTAMQDCRAVYHCAAQVSFNTRDKDSLYYTNVVGTQNVLHCASELSLPVCYLSSTAAIGDQPVNGVLSEESVWTSDKNRSHYSLSKRYAELEVHRAAAEGLEVVIVNPGIIIGPGKWGQSSTSMFMAGKRGMRFYPPGGTGFVDVRDVADFSLWALKNKSSLNGQHLLVGENIPFRSVFEMTAKAFDKKGPSVAFPSWPVKPLSATLKPLDVLGINPFAVTSESLKSAYRTTVFSNEKVKKLGFSFRSIQEAVDYTTAVFNFSS